MSRSHPALSTGRGVPCGCRARSRRGGLGPGPGDEQGSAMVGGPEEGQMGSTPMLEGYRVLDLGQYLAGAGVTRMLAELGPEIIKVELTPGGDPSRLLPWIV